MGGKLPCLNPAIISFLPLKLRIKNNFHSQILSSPPPSSALLYLFCREYTSSALTVNLTAVSSASSHLFSLPSPRSLPLSVSHLSLTTSVSWLVCCGSTGVCVTEHDQLMRTEPGVTYFPGTDGVLTGCTTNQGPLWCLESRLGLAKNRKFWPGATGRFFLSLELLDGIGLIGY